MGERQRGRMQGMTPRRQPDVRASIYPVAEHRMTEQRQVGAHLVRDSGPDRDADDGSIRARGEHLDARLGRPGAEAGRGGRHAPAVARVVRERYLDPGAVRRARVTGDAGEVALLDLAPGERRTNG